MGPCMVDNWGCRPGGEVGRVGPDNSIFRLLHRTIFLRAFSSSNLEGRKALQYKGSMFLSDSCIRRAFRGLEQSSHVVGPGLKGFLPGVRSRKLKTIMLVDDSATVLLSISGILAKAGFNVVTANSAEDGQRNDTTLRCKNTAPQSR